MRRYKFCCYSLKQDYMRKVQLTSFLPKYIALITNFIRLTRALVFRFLFLGENNIPCSSKLFNIIAKRYRKFVDYDNGQTKGKNKTQRFIIGQISRG